MEITERYRRSLKRKNFSAHTIKNYMNRIDQFTLWLRVPLEKTTRREIGAYVDHLLRKRRAPKTIACHLQTPASLLRTPHRRGKDGDGRSHQPRIYTSAKPLPRCLKDDQANGLFAVIGDPRDRAMFMLMLRLRASGSKRSPILR